MTWAEAKEAFVLNRIVGYKGGRYSINALCNRRIDGIITTQVILGDMNGNSEIVVKEEFMEEILDAE